jgi:predicted dehydrogenase/nucleoside-diphosphate-sugar epimerase
MAQARVGLVGAGYIASTHLEAIAACSGVVVGAVIDPNLKAAERLARQAPGAKVFASLDEALAANAIDRAHILVPPHLHHRVGSAALKAGLPTLMEKPLGVTAQETADLLQLAAQHNAPLGANQNFMFDPALLRFIKGLEAGRYGRLRHVSLVCAVPLRQLAGKQFGHWMFERPSNIILEQMVHPMSQLVRLLGKLEITSAVTKPAQELAPGLMFHRGFDVSFKSASGTAQLHMAFAENFPVWQLHCTCDDAQVLVDVFRSQVQVLDRTRYLEAGDFALSGAKLGLGTAWQSVFGVGEYLAGQLKLIKRPDAFFRSMRGSIEAFHTAVSKKAAPPIDGATAAHLVDLSLEIAARAGVSSDPVPAPKTLVPAGQPAPAYDVAVFGGTGFIGKATVEALVAAGFSVGVMARSMRGLPAVFHSDRVVLQQGDVTKPDDIARGIGSARYVVNLAHGGASGSREAIVATLVGSAQAVAQACLNRKIERLVFVGSIAGLFLGDAQETITANTPPDPLGAERADYAFAKAEADRALLAMHRDQGLPVTIHRPGVVVGDGASPFHSGLGLFNNEQHCLGWSAGRNALPFVLVEDCASAIVAALKAGPEVNGRTDNIVGGVRLSAREYIAELKAALGRPLKFHGQAVWFMQAIEVGKWLVKKAGGKKVPYPSARDLQSRGMLARFDTSGTEQALKWSPVKDKAAFLERGIHVPARALLDG